MNPLEQDFTLRGIGLLVDIGLTILVFMSANFLVVALESLEKGVGNLSPSIGNLLSLLSSQSVYPMLVTYLLSWGVALIIRRRYVVPLTAFRTPRSAHSRALIEKAIVKLRTKQEDRG